MSDNPSGEQPPRVMFGYVTPPLLVTALIVALVNMLVEMSRDDALLVGAVIFFPMFVLNLKLQPLLIARWRRRHGDGPQ